MSFSLSGQNISQRKISRMIDKIEAFDQAHIAVHIESINSRRTKIEYAGDDFMTPASNTKLLTFLAAVESFDSLPALYFHKQDSIMHFKATGYPLLFHPFYPDPRLESFFNQKYDWRYHRPIFKNNGLGKGWSWDDHSYYFAAESSPFPIYGNTTQAYGTSTSTTFFPKAFKNQISINKNVKNILRNPKKNQFLINPKFFETKDTLYRPFVTSDSLFVKLLSSHINQPISLNESKETLKWKVLFTQQDQLVYQALIKDSDNGVAEALMNMISQKKFGVMDTERTIDSIKLKWSNWLPDPLEWVDGSGISRYNMTTPRTLVSVLKKIYDHIGLKKIKNYFPESNRADKKVYAKTGTLRHNHNLSGYWIDEKGQVFAFSIMVNHHISSTNEISKGINELLEFFQKKIR